MHENKTSKWNMYIAPILFKAIIPVSITLLSLCMGKDVVENYIQKQSQHQEIVTLTPREGDIIVQENDVYKLIQLINKEDVLNSRSIIETMHSNCEVSNDINIVLVNEEKFTGQNCYSYRVPSVEINSNKLMNLINNIDTIVISLEFYDDGNFRVPYLVEENERFTFEVNVSEIIENEQIFNTTFNNIESNNYYVRTDLFNPGINHMRLSVSIVYEVDNKKIQTDYLFDDIEVVEDRFWN